MKAWKMEFNEKVKNYQWEINYEYNIGKGKYRVNGKPDGIGVL